LSQDWVAFFFGMKGDRMKNLEFWLAIHRAYSSQEALAKDIEMHVGTLSRLLHGWQKPTLEHRQKLAKALGEKKVRELFGKEAV
jgi:ribosome-binding protein aMBF1 (putative translation factor)